MNTPIPYQIPDAPVQVGVYIDAGFWLRLFYYFHERHEIRRKLDLGGVMDAARFHASCVFDKPFDQVAISTAHYFQGGRNGLHPEFGAVLMSLGVTPHVLPWDENVRRPIGLKSELILTCWEEAGQADMVMLIAGDDDFTPLASWLANYGARVLVPEIDVEHPARSNESRRLCPSRHLVEAATDTPAWIDLLSAYRNAPGLVSPFIH